MDCADKLLSKLDNVRPAGDKKWEALCPVHEDRQQSLSVSVGDDGRTLVYCHVGCATETIVAKVGLEMSDLFPSGESGKASHNGHHANGSAKAAKEKPKFRPDSEIAARYSYHDVDGTPLYQVLRYEDPKQFKQRRFKDGGGWLYTMAGTKYVPYRADELAAADPATIVFVFEGEKDVDRARSLGILATCNAMGAGKWRPSYNEHLRGRTVCIVPDNDKAGADHAQQVAQSVHGIAASVCILELPGLVAKGADASDWFNAGGTAEQLTALAEAAPEFAASSKTSPAAERGPTIRNFKLVPKGDDDEKHVPVPKSMGEIIADAQEVVGGCLRRVDSALFVHDIVAKPDDCAVDWLTTPSKLFGFLGSRGQVEWKSADGYVLREPFHAELGRTAPRHIAVEVLPHEPMMPGHYYACSAIEPGDGRFLQTLLDRFNPETPIDRDLILASILTQFWGGPGGARPAFLVTSRDGRGAGKSKTASMLTLPAGGALDFNQKDDFKQIKTRLLSDAGLTKRVAQLDNIKTLRFSWAELEGLITNPIVSGHRMFCGEGQRPNVLTWFITLNGASLSTDMAQRCIPIYIKRPVYTGNWEDETRAYIEANRQGIIADVIAALRIERFQLAKYMRWGSWEKDVLSRLPAPTDAQALIAERQEVVDVEEEEAGVIEDFFDAQLKRLEYDTAALTVHIPVAVVARWFNEATNTKHSVPAVTSQLKQMAGEGKIHRLQANPCRSNGRGFLWTGEFADVADAVRYDLAERLERFRIVESQDRRRSNYHYAGE